MAHFKNYDLLSSNFQEVQLNHIVVSPQKLRHLINKIHQIQDEDEFLFIDFAYEKSKHAKNYHVKILSNDHDTLWKLSKDF